MKGCGINKQVIKALAYGVLLGVASYMSADFFKTNKNITDQRLYKIASKLHENKNQRAQPIVENIVLHSPETENSSKKITRNGILMRFKDAKATIIIAHGYMTDKYDVAFLRNMFPYGQYNFLTYDFRAHGENVHGQFCSLGKYESLDVITAARFIKTHPDLNKKPLFVYGFSMGAVASIEAQAKEPLFDAMILDCPFDSSENVIKRLVDNIKFSVFGYQFTIPGRTILQKYAFHPYVQSLIKVLLKTIAKLDPRKVETNVHPVFPAQSAAKISVPCFFISCKKDEKVPVSSIKSVYSAAAGPKQLWLTNGRKHFDSYFYNPEKYVERVRLFVDQVLQGKWHNPEQQQIIEDVDEMLS